MAGGAAGWTPRGGAPRKGRWGGARRGRSRSGELHVEHLERLVDVGLVRRERGRLDLRSRVIKALGPPLVEPIRLLRARTVLAQPLKRHVIPGQRSLTSR